MADGPVDVAKQRNDFGEVGGSDDADGGEEGEAGGDEGEEFGAEELADAAVFEDEGGFDEDGDEDVMGFEADAEAGEEADGDFE